MIFNFHFDMWEQTAHIVCPIVFKWLKEKESTFHLFTVAL